MPDVRFTDVLSDFGPDTNFEDPISEGGRWERMIVASPPNVIKQGAMTNQDTDTLGYSYWTQESFDPTPEKPMEALGHGVGGGGGVGGYGWRVVLAQTPGPGGGFKGYMFLRFTALDGIWLLRKYSSEAAFSTLAGGDLGTEEALYRMWYDGSTIECWVGTTDGSSWSMVGSASDSEYNTGLFLAWGEEDQGSGQICAWDSVGGGIDDEEPQIYRRPFG